MGGPRLAALVHMARNERWGPDDRPSRDEDLRRRGPDQLSPERALQQSLGSSGSQRVGDSGPVANPEVSFPGEAPSTVEEESPTTGQAGSAERGEPSAGAPEDSRRDG